MEYDTDRVLKNKTDEDIEFKDAVIYLISGEVVLASIGQADEKNYVYFNALNIKQVDDGRGMGWFNPYTDETFGILKAEHIMSISPMSHDIEENYKTALEQLGASSGEDIARESASHNDENDFMFATNATTITEH